MVSKSSTASTPVTPRPVATAVAMSAARSAIRPADCGAGAMTSAQTPSRWMVSTTGHADTSPDGRRATSCASSRRNETSSSTSSAPPRAVFGEREEPVVDAVRLGDDADALAVVAAARGLHDGTSTVGVEEVGEVVGGLDGGPVGNGKPELGQLGAHVQLVLRVEERIRPRVHRDAPGDEFAQDRRRDVLVVEGDDIDGLGEREDRVEVAVVADARGRELGGHARRLLEDLDRDPELDRGRDHHPRKLSAADHTNRVPNHSPVSPTRIPSSARRITPLRTLSDGQGNSQIPLL